MSHDPVERIAESQMQAELRITHSWLAVRMVLFAARCIPRNALCVKPKFEIERSCECGFRGGQGAHWKDDFDRDAAVTP
jgi:hypothetical protein